VLKEFSKTENFVSLSRDTRLIDYQNAQIILIGARQGKHVIKNEIGVEIKDEKYINLETYRKNGQAVQTPVWFVIDGRTLYIRTDMSSGKVKRAKNNPRVRITPCNIRGQPKGKWIDGEMRMASIISESEKANKLLNHKYGLKGKIRTFNRLRNTKPMVFSIQI
jgi:PPOX class probable F420-dependent enzyme